MIAPSKGMTYWLLIIFTILFLFSGTNAHAQIKRGAVAEQPEAMRPPPPEDDDPQPPFNAAGPINQSVPQTMVAGGVYTVSITMKNTGNTTWTGDAGYGLGSSNPHDNWTWGIGRVTVPGEIPPDGFAQFTFQVTAPSTPGSYNFEWGMLQEYVEWFGNPSDNLVINVIASSNGQPQEPQIYGGGFALPPGNKSILLPGQSLRENQYIASPNDNYKLFMQGDGSFVMYRRDGTVSYRMAKHGAYVVMQTDGNLVEYNSDGTPIWFTNTVGCQNCFLEIFDNGSLRVGFHNDVNSIAWVQWGTDPDPNPVYQGTAGKSQMVLDLPSSPAPVGVPSIQPPSNFSKNYNVDRVNFLLPESGIIH
jgi:hypothetical protein